MASNQVLEVWRFTGTVTSIRTNGPELVRPQYAKLVYCSYEAHYFDQNFRLIFFRLRLSKRLNPNFGLRSPKFRVRSPGKNECKLTIELKPPGGLSERN